MLWCSGHRYVLIEGLARSMCNLSKGMTPRGSGGGGGEYSTKYYKRRLRPEVQPVTLLYTIFHEKGTHFVYLLLTNGTLFTYCFNSLEFCVLVNVTSLRYEWITKPECFLGFFTAIKCICLIALLGLFFHRNDRFPSPLISCTSTSKIPTLSYTWSLKLVPLSGGIGYYREYPSPPGKMHDTLMRLFSLQLDTFKSVFHLPLSRGCKLVWFETEIGSWTNSIHIKTSELILTARKVSSAHLNSLEPLSLELTTWRKQRFPFMAR